MSCMDVLFPIPQITHTGDKTLPGYITTPFVTALSHNSQDVFKIKHKNSQTRAHK